LQGAPSHTISGESEGISFSEGISPLFSRHIGLGISMMGTFQEGERSSDRMTVDSDQKSQVQDAGPPADYISRTPVPQQPIIEPSQITKAESLELINRSNARDPAYIYSLGGRRDNYDQTSDVDAEE
jgi:hypothetical protein